MFVLLLALAASCTAAPRPVPPNGGWVTEIAYQASDKLGACAVADVDPDHEGPEIITVCRTGHAFLVVREGDAWTPRIIGKTPGEMIQVAVGDVLPDRPGLEIVCVGAADGPEADDRPGQAWVFYREGRGWRSQSAYTSPKLLHAVTVHEGELLVAGYDAEVHALKPGIARWTSRSLGALPGPGKCAVTSGDTSWFACKDGSVVAYRASSGLATLHRRDAGRARLGTDGQRLAVCDDDGTLSLLSLAGEGTSVFREGDKLRGAVLADLDPAIPGSEIATVGYERRLSILTHAGGEWAATPVLRDSEKFHGLASGDLDGDGDHELVACGYSGRLFVIDRK